MTREEIRKKYSNLMKEVIKGNNLKHISEEFRKLNELCCHPFGEFNYDVGCWTCPDCGLRK